MNDGHQVLNHFALRRKGLLVRDGDLAAIFMSQVLEKVEAKAHQTILVRNYYMFYFTSRDSIDKVKKLWPFEIHAAADFFNPLVNGNARTEAKRLHRSQLRLQVVPLACTADTAINNRQLLFGFLTEDFSDVGLVKIAMPRRQPFCPYLPFCLPSTDS